MNIHLRLTCGRISIKRIAGDDNPHAVLFVYEESTKLNTDIISRLEKLNVQLLNKVDNHTVMINLFGNNYHNYV